jgi:magnesium transporter
MECEGFDIAKVSEYLGEDDTMVWIDMCAPSKEQLLQLAEELSLHELAVEDAVSEHQRPKLDRYESHLFMSMHAVRVDTESGELDQTEIDAFINSRWIVTVRKDEGFSMEPVLRRWDRSPQLAKNGVSFLLYGLIDEIVDEYFLAIQTFDDFYDEVSERIFSERPLDPEQQRQWFRMRQALVKFHRLVVPMREAVTGLMRREQSVVADPLYPYYQDVYDHLIRVVESTDALRDLVSTIVETNLSLRDYRQNLVMKQVTSWAAIIAVPTLITGYYGMNVPYPGAGQEWGVVVSGLLVVALSAGLYVLFRRRGWL